MWSGALPISSDAVIRAEGVGKRYRLGERESYKALRDVIGRLPHDPNQAVRAPEQRMIVSLLTAVQLADIQELARPDETVRAGFSFFQICRML